jgi:hypothetical protein
MDISKYGTYKIISDPCMNFSSPKSGSTKWNMILALSVFTAMEKVNISLKRSSISLSIGSLPDSTIFSLRM